jgi:bacillithiol system protein YtxJ
MQKIMRKGQAELLLARSSQAPVLVFKHSTRCGVSSGALKNLRAFEKGEEGAGVVIAYVDVIGNREVSGVVEQLTGVRHESPQAILLRNGEVQWHASHSAITHDALISAVQQSR